MIYVTHHSAGGVLNSRKWNLDIQFLYFGKLNLLQGFIKYCIFLATFPPIFIKWQTNCFFYKWTVLYKYANWIYYSKWYFLESNVFSSCEAQTGWKLIIIQCFVSVMDCNKLEIRIVSVFSLFSNTELRLSHNNNNNKKNSGSVYNWIYTSLFCTQCLTIKKILGIFFTF